MPYDTGNPNFFTTFKGKYQLVPEAGNFISDVVMLSCINDVQIVGDINLTTYMAHDTIGILPDECSPDTLVAMPVCVNVGGNITIEPFVIEPTGEMYMMKSFTSAHVYTSGMNFNISDRWYS